MKASAKSYRFASFTLNAGNHCLLSEDREIYLRPKTYDILVYLLRHQGQLVTKAELLDAVWGDVEVTENVLSQCIKEVRSALGDDVQSPHFLKTLPRLGYEFIAEVEGFEGPGSGNTIQEELQAVRVVTTEEYDEMSRSEHSPPEQTDDRSAVAGVLASDRSTSARRAVGWVVALTILAAGAALAIHFRSERGWLFGDSQTAHITSLAVLPLENLTGDPQQEYFADGMTEELITNLGKLRALRVVSRTSVMHYKRTDRPLPVIAKELHVDGVIEGAVQRYGNHVRITAQLIYGPTDKHLWAESYDGDVRDVLAMQSEVARAITNDIKAEITPQEMDRLAASRPVNPEAYALYLQGKELESRDNANDNRTAIETLERAVRIDPAFPPAYAALGRAFSDRLFLWEAKDEWNEKAEAAVDKALSLDPNLAEAHASRAALLFTPAHQWDYGGAIRECRRALGLNPNLADAHIALGMIWLHLGLLDEARSEFQTATEINPADPGPPLYVGFSFMFAGHWQDALPFLNTFADSPSAKIFRALCLWELGRDKEARKLDRELLEADPQEKSVYAAALHTLLLANAGQNREAEKRIGEKLLKPGEGMKRYGHFHHLANFIAMIYAQLNKPDLAVDWLEKTAANGFPCYPSFEQDRALDPIRQNPRFVAFLARQRSQWLTFKSTYGGESATGSKLRN
jgi:TolB-like protein/DNA-binding winged helix-turn-helix (wHTH) protein/tetratricopeptide (TPR) repeat protein